MANSRLSIKQLHFLLIFTGCLLTFIGLYHLIPLIPNVWDPKSDFYPYYQAGELIRAKKPIYTFPNNNQTPTTCMIFVPLTFLSIKSAALLWISLTSICYFWIGIIILLELRISLTFYWGFFLFSLALCWYPFLINITLGQISNLISLLIILAWLFLRQKKDIGAGILLGIACLLKLFPGIFLIYLFLRKKWMALGVMIVTILVGFLLTLLVVDLKDIVYYFINFVTRQSSIWSGFPLNLSLNSIIQTLFIGNSQFSPQLTPLIYSKPVTIILTLILDLTIVILLLRQLIILPTTTHGDNIAFNYCIICMLLLSPIAWQHYYTILLLPLGYVFKLFLQYKNLRFFRLGLLSFLFLSLPSQEIASFIIQFFPSSILPWYTVFIIKIPILGIFLLLTSGIYITRNFKNIMEY